MQTPIITDETLSQMSLMRLTSYTLSLLAEALPHVANVETAEANAQASATAAASSADSASTSAASAAASESSVETAVNAGVTRINSATENGLASINAAVTTVLNTEV